VLSSRQTHPVHPVTSRQRVSLPGLIACTCKCMMHKPCSWTGNFLPISIRGLNRNGRFLTSTVIVEIAIRND
jgi:hypothetical protein